MQRKSYHQLAALLAFLILTWHNGIVFCGGVMSTLRKQHLLNETITPSSSSSSDAEDHQVAESKQPAPPSPQSSEGDFILLDFDPNDQLQYETQTKALKKKKNKKKKRSSWLRFGRWNQTPSPKLRSRSASPTAQHYYPNSDIIDSYLDDQSSIGNLQKSATKRRVHRRSKSLPHLTPLMRSKSLDHSDYTRLIKKSPSHGAVSSIPFVRPARQVDNQITTDSSDDEDEELFRSLSRRNIVAKPPPSFSFSSSSDDDDDVVDVDKKTADSSENVVLDTSNLQPEKPRTKANEEDSQDRPITPPNSPYISKKMNKEALTSSMIANMNPEFRRMLHQRLRAMGVCGQLAQIKENQVQSSSVDDLLTPLHLQRRHKTSNPSSSFSPFAYTPSQAAAAAAGTSKFPYLHTWAAMILCDSNPPNYWNKEFGRMMQATSSEATVL